MRDFLLTVSLGGDSHAAIVDLAARMLGMPTVLFSQASLVGRGDFSIEYREQGPCIGLGEAEFELASVKTFWNRRSSREFVMPADTHPADHAHLGDCATKSMQGLRAILDTTFAVNPSWAAENVAAKPNQLRVAKNIGLRVPETVITNCPRAVRALHGRVGDLCVKPLAFHAWRSETASYGTYSQRVSNLDQLPEDSVNLVPMIYQAWVDKAFEVRIVAFGNYLCATKINLNGAVDTIDWRKNLSYLHCLEPIDPPATIASLIHALMKGLNLRFGTIDFVVDRGGAWHFLEINEAGQFLWQEEFCEDCRVLEPFVRFLRQGDDCFEWSPASGSAEFGAKAVAGALASHPEYHPFLSEPGLSLRDLGKLSRETAELAVEAE